MSDRRDWWKRKRRWAAVAVWLIAAYPLSLGPMIWLYDRGYLPASALAYVDPFYAPLGLSMSDGRGGVRASMRLYVWYLNLFHEDDTPLP